MKRFLLVSLCLTIVFLPHYSHAQSALGQLSSTNLEITLDPAYPEPGEKVTASLNNFVSSLYGAEIRWYIGGTERQGVRNQTEMTFVAEPSDSSFSVEARITATTGQTQTVSKTVTPRYLDIIVEPQTHVPDFYAGRALPTPGSVVNLTALMDGTTENSSNLTYTWRINQKVLNSGGQRGQYKTSFTMPLDSQVLISLEVAGASGAVIAKRSFFLPNSRPVVHFYEVSSLYGLLTQPIETLSLTGNSVTVRAEPFYLDSRVYNNPDVRTWEINRRAAAGGSNPYELTVQKTGASGSSVIDFRVQSTSQALQGDTAEFRIFY